MTSAPTMAFEPIPSVVRSVIPTYVGPTLPLCPLLMALLDPCSGLSLSQFCSDCVCWFPDDDYHSVSCQILGVDYICDGCNPALCHIWQTLSTPGLKAIMHPDQCHLMFFCQPCFGNHC